MIFFKWVKFSLKSCEIFLRTVWNSLKIIKDFLWNTLGWYISDVWVILWITDGSYISYGICYRFVIDEFHVGHIRVNDGSHMGPRIGYRWVTDESHMGKTLLHTGVRWITGIQRIW